MPAGSDLGSRPAPELKHYWAIDAASIGVVPQLAQRLGGT